MISAQTERRAAQLQALQAARSQRAYQVVEEYHIFSPRPGTVRLISPTGASYKVVGGRCDCPDAQRHPELRCKHLEAVALVEHELCPDCEQEPCICPDPSDEELCGVQDVERRIRARAERALWG